jgi:hypothetical protein
MLFLEAEEISDFSHNTELLQIYNSSKNVFITGNTHKCRAKNWSTFEHLPTELIMLSVELKIPYTVVRKL